MNDIRYYIFSQRSGGILIPYCSKCGFKYNEEYQFCPECGGKRTDVVILPIPIPIPPVPTQTPSSAAYQKGLKKRQLAKSSKKRSRSIWILIAVIIVVIIIIISLIGFIRTQIDSKPPYITETYPHDGSKNVDVKTSFRIVWSEPMFESKKIGDALVVETPGGWDYFAVDSVKWEDSQTVVLENYNSLPYDTTFTAMLVRPNWYGIEDVNGNVPEYIDEDEHSVYTWSFTTEPA